jgi:lipopolysaccharide export system protein LptA
MYKLIIVIIIMIFSSPLRAEDKLFGSNKETIITSNSLMVDQLNNLADFKGEVIAKQENLTLKADQMLVYYHKENDQNTSNISKIITIGNVVIIDGEQTATGDTAEYITKDETMELKGSVTLIKNKDVIKGERLVYSFKTGHSSLFSGNDNQSRIKAIFTPGNSK